MCQVGFCARWLKYSMKWSVLRQASACNNITKKCHLCLTEKLMIGSAEKKSSLNKRSEHVRICHHENKYFKVPATEFHLAHSILSYFVTYCSSPTTPVISQTLLVCA